ncbi:[FeFe] hydrogenase, group A [Clostridium sp. C2-6-12]|uniref:[FeFe] hydrogenase, group A n=1 Tax=Clostridium sp. C2-6-12 TaxID=2698832 RepID=UPI00136F5426|nr:[FeFe] hydrogenase, group A [Clostridium sp. C2-6-12]
MSGQFMTIDNVPVEIRDEKNILELVRRAGIELPTFCFYSELSVYGACRMCMVETKRGDMESACSTPPRAGMEIYTNTPRLRRYRKNILELLLANHCRDCTTCQQSGACKLQELAKRFGINDVRFPNTAKCNEIDDSSVAIVRNKSKCILCGDCVRVCEEVQNVGVIDFVGRGSKMTVTTAFDEPIGNSNCVSCGQCAAVCPTGAIVVRSKTDKLWEELNDPNTKVVVQIAPAVRVGISSKLEEDGRYAMGKMVAALRRMGFDFIFDTSVGADLTVIEETNEFVSKLQKNEDLPLFTSCCPAWVKYAENTYPDLMKNVSSCKSPMEMFGAVLKEHYKDNDKRLVSVAIMPCSAKKFEADREEFKRDGIPDVDYVVTTQELINMINESGIAFSELEPEALDRPFQSSSGAGVIFGVTGGVTEAVLRKVLSDTPVPALRALAFEGVRGMEGVKETTITALGREIKIAIVSGLKNADNVIKKIKAGEAHYDFIEVMACPGGCIAGAGQPFAKAGEKYGRSVRLYKVDKMKSISRSDDNPLMDSLYSGVLKGRAHELLHVHYNNHK